MRLFGTAQAGFLPSLGASFHFPPLTQGGCFESNPPDYVSEHVTPLHSTTLPQPTAQAGEEQVCSARRWKRKQKGDRVRGRESLPAEAAGLLPASLCTAGPSRPTDSFPATTRAWRRGPTTHAHLCQGSSDTKPCHAPGLSESSPPLLSSAFRPRGCPGNPQANSQLPGRPRCWEPPLQPGARAVGGASDPAPPSSAALGAEADAAAEPDAFGASETVSPVALRRRCGPGEGGDNSGDGLPGGPKWEWCGLQEADRKRSRRGQQRPR